MNRESRMVTNNGTTRLLWAGLIVLSAINLSSLLRYESQVGVAPSSLHELVLYDYSGNPRVALGDLHKFGAEEGTFGVCILPQGYSAHPAESPLIMAAISGSGWPSATLDAGKSGGAINASIEEGSSPKLSLARAREVQIAIRADNDGPYVALYGNGARSVCIGKPWESLLSQIGEPGFGILYRAKDGKVINLVP